MTADSIVDYQIRLQSALASLTSTLIGEFSAVIAAARTRRSQVWLAGNGGSAMTASHFATDLLRCADLDGRPVRATSLCANMGVISAISNDYGYEEIFSRQLQMGAQPGDVLVIITASGNSSNLVEAMEWARENSVSTIGLTGFDGGLVHQSADLSIHVKSKNGDYGVVEDAHLAACHMVAECLRSGRIASTSPEDY